MTTERVPEHLRVREGGDVAEANDPFWQAEREKRELLLERARLLARLKKELGLAR